MSRIPQPKVAPPPSVAGRSAPRRAHDREDGGFKAAELAQRGRMILDVAAADLAAAESLLGPFHETTWYFRQALADARLAWDRLRVLHGQRALEAALAGPPATILTLGEKADGSDPAAILLVIAGRTYRVRRLRGTAMAPILWRLDRFHAADLSELESDPFALDPCHPARLAGGRPVCDCGEWFFRVAEAEHPTGLCKHLAALRALGWV